MQLAGPGTQRSPNEERGASTAFPAGARPWQLGRGARAAKWRRAQVLDNELHLGPSPSRSLMHVRDEEVPLTNCYSPWGRYPPEVVRGAEGEH